MLVIFNIFEHHEIYRNAFELNFYNVLDPRKNGSLFLDSIYSKKFYDFGNHLMVLREIYDGYDARFKQNGLLLIYIIYLKLTRFL